jgi:hypothetical protein
MAGNLITPRIPYLLDEEERLIHLVQEEQRMTWKQIGARMPGRNGNSVKVQYLLMLKDWENRAEIMWTPNMTQSLSDKAQHEGASISDLAKGIIRDGVNFELGPVRGAVRHKLWKLRLATKPTQKYDERTNIGWDDASDARLWNLVRNGYTAQAIAREFADGRKPAAFESKLKTLRGNGYTNEDAMQHSVNDELTISGSIDETSDDEAADSTEEPSDDDADMSSPPRTRSPSPTIVRSDPGVAQAHVSTNVALHRRLMDNLLSASLGDPPSNQRTRQLVPETASEDEESLPDVSQHEPLPVTGTVQPRRRADGKSDMSSSRSRSRGTDSTESSRSRDRGEATRSNAKGPSTSGPSRKQRTGRDSNSDHASGRRGGH